MTSQLNTFYFLFVYRFSYFRLIQINRLLSACPPLTLHTDFSFCHPSLCSFSCMLNDGERNRNHNYSQQWENNTHLNAKRARRRIKWNEQWYMCAIGMCALNQCKLTHSSDGCVDNGFCLLYDWQSFWGHEDWWLISKTLANQIHTHTHSNTHIVETIIVSDCSWIPAYAATD